MPVLCYILLYSQVATYVYLEYAFKRLDLIKTMYVLYCIDVQCLDMFSFLLKYTQVGYIMNAIVKLFRLARQLLLIMSKMKGVSGQEGRM